MVTPETTSMNHYEKLTVIILRIVGLISAIHALVLPLVSLIYYPLQVVLEGSYSSLIYLAQGVALFLLSKPLAALIARKL